MKDDILQPTFAYFNMLQEHEDKNSQGQSADQTSQWLIRYVALLALSSSIEGPSPEAIENAYRPHLGWVFGNASGPTIMRTRVAAFFCLIAQSCPDLLVEKDQQITQSFIDWYCNCMNNEQEPQVVYGAACAMSQLFMKLQSSTP